MRSPFLTLWPFFHFDVSPVSQRIFTAAAVFIIKDVDLTAAVHDNEIAVLP